MCGFVALCGNKNETLMRHMLDGIRHRGPDGEGVLQIGATALGHVRLAILDVTGGLQPMSNETGELAVAFNGEIYNHLELRERLESRHCFKTRSDTEVLLHLYEEEAEDMLAKLDGMFAFALAGPKGLLLARDPIGIKPLYYGWKDGQFLAASELKAFPPMDSLHALPAGHFLVVGEEPRRFAPPFPPMPAVNEISVEKAAREIRHRLDQAVRKRLMSDVPVGVFLSGGLDSSLVAALMRPHTVELHSFTAGMAGAPDLAAAREAAEYLDTEHHELIYTEEDMEQALPEIIHHLESFDAPLVRSAIPMYFISKLAAQHVKVALSGEGADELFAGYEYLKELRGGQVLRNELNTIILRLQDTNLQRADRMTMAHGLEARVPFLDTNLVRFMSRLPVDFVAPAADRPEKWLLREACKGLLPPSLLNRKKLKFSEGAGSAEIIARRLAATLSSSEYESAQQEALSLGLRSPEEVYYFKLWHEVMGQDIPPELVGRTSDKKAAA
ncbi:MAG TPA: asparagine synthase B [Candidatus Hydrogenedentes bacterium]|nr:asparagine synthase B [Candidatus Hydrogenedentota bacterium]